MDIIARPTEYERPEAHNLSMWVDEAIWGHRLYDEQSPWLTILEFLSILVSEREAGRVLEEAQYNSLCYTPLHQLFMRNILFKNPHLARIGQMLGNDDAKWAEWAARMEDSAEGLSEPDFLKVRDSFDHFDDFAAVVSFLQRSAIEGNSNKRWSSKFVFPFGPNCLYQDLRVSADGASADRRFFGRTGELLYMMLCRSKEIEALRARIGKLCEATDYDGIAAALQVEKSTAPSPVRGGYLPCKESPLFDNLAEDWIRLLDLDVPPFDILPYLVSISGLHLTRYFLERAREAANSDEAITFVCEIVAPRKNVIRDISANSFQRNNVLSATAVERYIRALTDEDAWKEARNSDDPRAACMDLVKEKYCWPTSKKEEAVPADPDDIIDELVRDAVDRHRRHLGNVHNAWGRAIGLSSRRSSRRTRYAPTDRLLKTLVLTCVDGQLELREFLSMLYTRYGLVIGDQQATPWLERGEADQRQFTANQRRLEERLASLGLLERLSDSCAYVINRFERKQS